jgi:hypothetical protein
LSDVESITAMMDPPSSFIFENIPFHLKHHLLLKPKHFCFLKEGNAVIGLTPNFYHLMLHSSDKEFKITRKR